MARPSGAHNRSNTGRISDTRLPSSPHRDGGSFGKVTKVFPIPPTGIEIPVDEIFIVSQSIPTGVLAYNYSFQIQAVGPAGVEIKFFRDSGVWPNGWEMDDKGFISGQATESGQFSVAIAAHAPDRPDIPKAYHVYNFGVAVAPILPSGSLEFITTSIPTGIEDTFYTTILLGNSGDSGTLAWSVAPGSALPSQLILNSVSGTISGYVDEIGDHAFTIQLDDGINASVYQDFILTVLPNAVGQIVITNPKQLPQGVVGQNYAYQFTTVGQTSPVKFSYDETPPGLSIGLIDGLLSGVPSTEGDYEIVLTASSDTDLPTTQTYYIKILAANTVIIVDPIADLTGGEDLHISWTVTPFPLSYTPSWRIRGFIGTNPIGDIPIVPTDNLDGTYELDYPVPTTVFGDDFAIQIFEDVSDAFGFSNQFDIDAYPTISIVSYPLSFVDTGQPYASDLIATGGLDTLVFTEGTGFPPGITMDAAGAVSGSCSTAGSYTCVFSITDGHTTISGAFTINVLDPSEIVIETDAAMPDATEGIPYSLQLTETGSSGPVTWSDDGGLAASGLTLDSGTGEWTGTPTTPGLYTVEVTASDGIVTDGVKTFTLTIHADLGPGEDQIITRAGTVFTITGDTNTNINTGFTGNAQIQVSGTPVNFEIGSLDMPWGSGGLGINIRSNQNELTCRNRGYRAGMGHDTQNYTTLSGEPFYFTSVQSNRPNRVIYFGINNEWLNVRHVGDVFNLIDPADPKHPVTCQDASLPGARYAPSREFHMLDGGDRFHFRFAPASDPTESYLEPDATAQSNAASIINQNATRIAAWPLLEYTLDTYRHDPATYNNPNVAPASRRWTWNLRSENYAANYSTNPYFDPAEMPVSPWKNWYLSFLPFSPADSTWPRPAIYWTSIGVGQYFLRHPTDTATFRFGLQLIRKKICVNQNASDRPNVYQNTWTTEGTGSQPAAGPYPLQVGRIGGITSDYYDKWWKAHGPTEVAFWHMLVPDDLLIADSFDRCIQAVLDCPYSTNPNLYGIQRSQVPNGNYRDTANILLGGYCLFKACIIKGGAYTAIAAQLKNKCEILIETMFACIDNSPGTPKPLWIPLKTSTTNTDNSPLTAGPGPPGTGASSRGMETLPVAISKWMGSSGSVDGTGINTNPTRLAYWKLMMTWWFTNLCPVATLVPSWNGGGIRRSQCYGFQPIGPTAATWNNTPNMQFNPGNSTTPSQNTGFYGSWMTPMRQYMEAWYPGPTDAPGGISYSTFFDQLERYNNEMTSAGGGHLVITGPNAINSFHSGLNYGNGLWPANTWAGKFINEGFLFQSMDF